MRTMQSDLDRAENRQSSQRHAADQGVSDVAIDTACKGVQALAPPGSRKKIWEEVLFLSICISIYLRNLQQTVGPFGE